jgi:hypothetical protein
VTDEEFNNLPHGAVVYYIRQYSNAGTKAYGVYCKNTTKARRGEDPHYNREKSVWAEWVDSLDEALKLSSGIDPTSTEEFATSWNPEKVTFVHVDVSCRCPMLVGGGIDHFSYCPYIREKSKVS